MMSSSREFSTFIRREFISRNVMHLPFKFHYMMFRPRPTFIANKSWDNLILLDGCRFDAFAKVNNIHGELIKIVSAGSCTMDWLRNNFSHCDMKDVVYISANPFASYYFFQKMLQRTPFYKIVEVWKDSWSEELRTVPPSAVNEATLDSLNLYPQKRLLIHYMQPHHPFIGGLKMIDEEPGGDHGR